jgi:hypothetical protein
MADFRMLGTVIGDASEDGSREKLVHVRVPPQHVKNREGEEGEVTATRTLIARRCARMREAGIDVSEGHEVAVIAPLEPTGQKATIIHRTDIRLR